MLRARIARLERRLAPPDRLGTCEACGGPSPGIPILEFVDALGNPIDARCPSCSLPLDAQGRGFGQRPRNAVMYVKQIVMEGDPGPLFW
jgi:hypothetical protein